MRQALWSVGAVSVLGFALWFVNRQPKLPALGSPAVQQGASGEPSASRPAVAVSLHSMPLPSSAGRVELQHVVLSSDGVASAEAFAAWHHGLKDRQRADLVRAQLRATPTASRVPPAETRTERYPGADSSANQAASEVGRAIRRRIAEQYFPMVSTCYESALTRSPGLAGKLALQFAIGGNAEIGGVVTEVSLRDDATLRDAELLECIKESLYGVFFDPPESEGGEITVVYPLELAPSAP
jgi:hypothetical protein